MQKGIVPEDIHSLFSADANPANALPMAAYMKHIAPFYGIKAPERRQLQKEIFQQYRTLSIAEVGDLAMSLYSLPERELHYLAMDWLYHRRKDFTPDTIHLIEHMLITKSWWDTVDHLSTRVFGAWAAMYPTPAKQVVKRFIKSDNFWLNRAAILHQLHYGTRTDTGLLTQAILPHSASREFFLQKAIGWALRHYARTSPDWVREFVAQQPLAALSRREALKHL